MAEYTLNDSELAQELAVDVLRRITTHLGVRGAEIDYDNKREHMRSLIAECRTEFLAQPSASPQPAPAAERQLPDGWYACSICGTAICCGKCGHCRTHFCQCKHCSTHGSYNANCNNCRVLNGESQLTCAPPADPAGAKCPKCGTSEGNVRNYLYLLHTWPCVERRLGGERRIHDSGCICFRTPRITHIHTALSSRINDRTGRDRRSESKSREGAK